jgi:hypothetical protein
VASPPLTDIGTPDFWWGQVEPEWFENTYELNFPESVVTYSRMRHDPQIKAVLNAYILPILRATWVIDPDGARDEVAQHVADDLGVNILGQDERPGAARRRGVVWQRHLRQALYEQLVFGFMAFERRYRIEDDGSAHLDHLGARMPWSVARINTNRDGTIESLEQVTQAAPIPANRLVWYVNDLEGGNWTGMSLLRRVDAEARELADPRHFHPPVRDGCPRCRGTSRCDCYPDRAGAGDGQRDARRRPVGHGRPRRLQAVPHGDDRRCTRCAGVHRVPGPGDRQAGAGQPDRAGADGDRLPGAR